MCTRRVSRYMPSYFYTYFHDHQHVLYVVELDDLLVGENEQKWNREEGRKTFAE